MLKSHWPRSLLRSARTPIHLHVDAGMSNHEPLSARLRSCNGIQRPCRQTEVHACLSGPQSVLKESAVTCSNAESFQKWRRSSHKSHQPPNSAPGLAPNTNTQNCTLSQLSCSRSGVACNESPSQQEIGNHSTPRSAHQKGCSLCALDRVGPQCAGAR